MKEIIYSPIGIIHSPFYEIQNIPIQPCFANGIKGSIELKKEYIDGLSDLDDFSHIILLYHFHLSSGYSLKVTPFLDETSHGLFSTRAPKRPNGIGLSVVKLIEIKKNILFIENIDIVDGTPLLDIKPWVGKFNNVSNEKNGWLENWKDIKTKNSDNRFK